MGDDGEYLYAHNGKGNVIRLFHSPYSHAEGKQETAIGQYSHAEDYATRPFDSYSQQAEALAQTLSKAAAQTGVSMSELADARAIEAKALAEAEGLLKKAEALEKYGDAAREQQKLDVIKVLFEQYPAIAQAIGEGYAGVDKIVMLGGDSNQLAGNMMNTITQVQEGLGASLGIDLKSLLSGMFGAKLIGNNGVTVNVDGEEV